MNSHEDTLSKFKIVKRKDNHIQAYCPAHVDKNASLSILLSGNKMLLYCHAGCRVEDILKSARLTYADLFLDSKPPINIFQYKNKDGSLSHEKLKFATTKGKRFAQRRIHDNAIVENLDGIERIPYNYPEVITAIKQGNPIVFVEGEKDADSAELLGYVATTIGGASDWRDEYKKYFKNASVIQVPDKDTAGVTHIKKVSKSLSEVCKSLKVVILPQGKDLTEWIELGNSNLKALIDNSQDLIVNNGVPNPTMTVNPSGYTLDWIGLNLKIVIDRIKNDDYGEISVYNGGDTPTHISGMRLLSLSHKASLARELKNQRDLDWNIIINQVATKCLADIRRGESVVMLDSEYGRSRPEYLLHPLFVKNAANIIYADKSSAKSLFMTLVDVALTLPWHDNPIGFNISPNDIHKVLFLDWENDAEITGWQKECLIRGMNIDWCELPYLHCSRPLCDSIDHIRAKIVEIGADVVIIDSLGMAVGDDLNLTKPAFVFYGALRQLPVTPIIIAHTSKDISMKRKTVYGNAYYENEARCYSFDTEVLTKAGWKLHKDITLEDEVCCYEVTTNGQTFRWDKPIKLWEYDYEGYMIAINHKETEALITPKHRVLTNNHGIIEAEKLLHYQRDSYQIPYSGILRKRGSHNGRQKKIWQLALGNKHLNIDTFLRFLGYWISEGGLNGYTKSNITLTQNEGAVLDKWLSSNCGDKFDNKRLPDFIWGLSVKQLKILLDALIEGAGHQYEAGHACYSTVSQRLADDIQRLAMLVGLTAKITSRKRKIGQTQFELLLSKPNRFTRTISPRQCQRVNYSGKVYCLTVPTGFYVTRRNGTTAILGNSVWEVSKHQDPGSNELTITLHHRKSPPFAGYHEPLAWRFIFEENKIKIDTTDPYSDKRENDNERSNEDKILGVLMLADKHLAAHEIIKLGDDNIKEGSIRTTLNRLVKKHDSDIGRDIDGKYYYKP